MRYSISYKPTTLREKMIAVLIYFVIMAILWLSTVIMPGDIKIEGIGSLIVVSALYYILGVLALLLVLLIGCRLFNLTIAFVITIAAALFVGIPLLLLFNTFINGFWINDAGSAFIVSFLVTISTSLVGFLLREH